MGAAHRNLIGLSEQHRPIICLPRGRVGASVKVLIFAGQHGDERPARRTVRAFIDQPPEEVAGRLPHLQLAVIPEANPDGCAVRSRCNAMGIDLNRDHQLLFSAETAALHRFVRQWQPHLILDLHSYPSRRRHLLEQNVVLDHDVFMDVPNHPAILARPACARADEVLRGLLRAIAARDVCADRYTIVKASGRARHSTADVVDARNGLALRYGVFTILVENRQPRREETPDERLRLRAAQDCALWAILDWLDHNHDLFPSMNASNR
jgi:predicted deacylase